MLASRFSEHGKYLLQSPCCHPGSSRSTLPVPCYIPDPGLLLWPCSDCYLVSLLWTISEVLSRHFLSPAASTREDLLNFKNEDGLNTGRGMITRAEGALEMHPDEDEGGGHGGIRASVCPAFHVGPHAFRASCWLRRLPSPLSPLGSTCSLTFETLCLTQR